MARSTEKGNLPILDGIETDANEQYDPSGRMDTGYRKCRETLEQLHPSELKQRVAFINRATNDLGLHADRLREQAEEIGAFSMDLYPRILRPVEWERIQAGVMQRAAAFSSYIRDIYHGRKILHAGILPPEIVFEDPAFHPELHGIPMDPSDPVTVGAVDLIRTTDGQWQVLENRFSTPTGISFVVQLRRILAQALPELFEKLPVLPISSFVTRLSEALSELANHEGDEPDLVVLLSEGEAGRHFFEESFLARHMGIPLARTGDIVVREGKVFLKTIHGLRRIHVIYRRLEPAQLDPVAFATGRESGIPGLIQCARKGTVKVVNAMGCGVADNRALLGYSDEIIRFYTGQQPILRTVPTYHGYDLDQRDWILDHAGESALKTVCHPETLGRSNPEAYKLFLAGKLREILRKDSRLIVAQKLPETSRLPVYRDGAFSLQSLSMRAFFIGGRNPYVLPGGLTRLFHSADERLPVGRHHHALKDTWALREHQPKARRSRRLEPGINIPESPLTSRAAEAFYWMGRYLERARGTARMLNTLEELRWGELAPGERTLYAPLLGAIMATTGQRIQIKRQSADLSLLINPLLFDAANPASVRSCLAMVRNNASSIRSFITPEFWNSIREAEHSLDLPSVSQPRGTALREIMEQMVEAGDRIYGAGQRTLLHDAGWQFLNTGMMLERSVTHVTILAKVLPKVALRQWEHLRDDTDLTTLLRLLGSLDAYHRKYRSRAYLDRVTQLLWQTPACTASVLHTVREILKALTAIDGETNGRVRRAGMLENIATFETWLIELPLETIFPARALELDRGLTRRNAVSMDSVAQAERCMHQMQAFLEELHARLEDSFFSHHPDNERSKA